MSEENIKKSIAKYNSGTSSLVEEKLLFEDVDQDSEILKDLGTFIKKNKKETPKNLNDKLWLSFDKKTKQQKRFKVGLFSAAASIALIFSLYINNVGKNELSNNEKEILLNEAKSMFSNTIEKKSVENIIFESDMIIVYTKTE